MKTKALRLVTALVAMSLCFIALHSTFANSKEDKFDISYSTSGDGPRILILHDSSANDLHWAECVKQLSCCFEVTLLDVGQLTKDHEAIKFLRQSLDQLGISYARIAGSIHTEELVNRYAAAFPEQSRSFILPRTSENMQILAELFNSSTLLKS